MAIHHTANRKQFVSSWLERVGIPDATAPSIPFPNRKYLFRGQPIILQGLLLKRGKINVAYQCRLFVLTNDGVLHYFIHEGMDLRPGLKVHIYECTHKCSIYIGKDSEIEDGGMDLGMHTISIRVSKQTAFGLSTRTYHVATSSLEEHRTWLDALHVVRAGGFHFMDDSG